MSVFVNCTDSRSACQVDGQFSFNGVAGTCDVVSGLCLCPPGYSGLDLLSVWNDCHISTTARTAVEATSLACNVAALVAVIYAIVHLLRSWEARPIRLKGFIPWLEFPPPEPSHVSYQRQINERRKRRIFIAIFANLFNFCAIGTIFQAILLADPVFSVFERPNGLGIFLISIDIGAIVVALYMVLFAWFDALPSFRLFSKMFPQIRNAFLVRYPNFIFVNVVLNTTLTCTISFGLFFVTSMARPDSIRTIVIPWGMTVFGAELAIFVSILISVCVLLLRLITVFSTDSSGRASPGRPGVLSQEARGRFREARRTIFVMLITAIICGPISVALCLIMAWHPYVHANFFFFVALFQGAGAAVAIFTVFVFVFRMQYATKRATGDNASLISGQVDPGGMSADVSISLGGDIHSPNPKYSFVSLEKSSFA